ncbi:uncharacterized protein LOC134700020 isoform X1 [Mytilus trossulus]|uniref:uncharacterized protein LOC134700020 isoform X1 n=1 Tax=Mytilus trossulus TaxID=6551 RepID=UPI0030076821
MTTSDYHFNPKWQHTDKVLGTDYCLNVNSVNPSAIKRDVADIKKKWQDIQSLAKKKESARLQVVKKTGGGPPPDDTLKSWEKNIIGTFTKTMVEGIEGGFDTSDTSDTSVDISCGSGAVGGQPKSNDDHGYLERVHGPIATLIPARYHQFIDGQTLKSYVASNERDAQIFKQKAGPADIPVITKKTSNKVYSQITDNLTDSGKDAINDINPNLFNLLIDWCPDFESFVCSKPVPAQQDNLIQSVDEMPVDRNPTDDLNEDVGSQAQTSSSSANSSFASNGKKRAAISNENASSERYFILKASKLQKVEEYRAQKLKIMEQMLEMQRRSTVALEAIRASQHREQQYGIDLQCLSPVIKFSESYFDFFLVF